METIKNTLETEAIFSDDQQHRYLLKNTWDSEKQTITIITMYPNYTGLLRIDLTTQLIINKISEMDAFGSINFVNLYSNITTPINLKHLESFIKRKVIKKYYKPNCSNRIRG